ncbi:MAG: transglycosylase SLT domain-containing protein [Candidatus Sulfotelmatobacter sp.]|jgi:membrane-bound lytic murein transglycosylase D
MRVAKLHVRIATLALLTLAVSSCQTAKKPASLVPAKTVPALTATKAAPQQTSPQQTAPPASSVATEKTPPAQTQTSTQAPDQDKTKPESPSPRPTADTVGNLIASVEKDYQAGLDAYQAGQTDAAKQDFDKAINALLESTLDIRSDDRLQQEFDRIVEGVNRLDLASLGYASDSDAQKSEPAPIDETNGIVPSADPNVRAKAQAEIKSTRSDLPLMMTDQVAGYISYFSNRGRGTFERAFARSGRYHDMMVSILKQEGVPQDLIYLAQAESGFHPLAVSRVGARGIWQFMASRARGYGLQHNPWVDDRQDPEKSTRAAARHLKDLYAQFGDWYLAMAAYNSGPGTVQAAVKRTGYADFWELYRRNVLPKETRNYVPIILAMTIVSKNLSQYGFDDVSMDEPVASDAVTIDYPVDLRLVAQCVDATPAQLQDLNPSLLRLTTPRQGTFVLHLPSRTKDQYLTAIAAVPPDMRLWWRYHKVQPGDTLASLSRSYRVPAKSIAAANHLDSTDKDLEADSKLLIPLAVGKHPASDTATYARRITRYRVHKGDTVESVAENFGVSPQMVRRWNGLPRGSSLRGRKVLALHLPVSPSTEALADKPAAHARRTTQTASAKLPAENPSGDSTADSSGQPAVLRHTVKSGETLYSIATTYKTTVAALKRNNRNVAVLRPGMILVVEPSR